MFKAIHNYRENGGIIDRSTEPDRRPYERLLGEFTGLRKTPVCAREFDEKAVRRTARARKVRLAEG
ncbi:hypothetical protein BV394_01025 [Brevirhabdus pacifica]|uniref:Uncharacterized protein n=1 Tax=Brevirhabdus pacifica TaxID=1267768 RepID=A0A1U7DER5_9RHOB|nr:hypothetical protein [Brevirhabdus pacifica]APX88484.1 hypothetical protein BV394_01025 [Brevirhabdus pacifica]OWU79788.1 hypothetical protein ATO5_01725 [Loktanella sp. 22II-4b]PJJ87041.1 hypothetical protein CLV77_1605 [Brevirhabdus pacifica]